MCDMWAAVSVIVWPNRHTNCSFSIDNCSFSTDSLLFTCTQLRQTRDASNLTSVCGILCGTVATVHYMVSWSHSWGLRPHKLLQRHIAQIASETFVCYICRLGPWPRMSTETTTMKSGVIAGHAATTKVTTGELDKKDHAATFLSSAASDPHWECLLAASKNHRDTSRS